MAARDSVLHVAFGLSLGVLGRSELGGNRHGIARLRLPRFRSTAFYHRYFSHRAFKTSRWFQFVGHFLGNAAAQRGPLWWAAHHREHHRHSDREGDVHSPHVHGFLWSHMGWFMEGSNFSKDRTGIRDLTKYPELRFLDRYDLVAPVVLALGMFFWGATLERWSPQLGTNGWQMLVWGFLVSTVILYHVTYAINSLAHVFGSQRFPTADHSRNNLWLALITFGEGWHNNHHYYPSAARQGFYWWEIDVTYYILRAPGEVGNRLGLAEGSRESFGGGPGGRPRGGCRWREGHGRTRAAAGAGTNRMLAKGMLGISNRGFPSCRFPRCGRLAG